MRANQIKVGQTYEGAGFRGAGTTTRRVVNITKQPNSKYGDGIVDWVGVSGSDEGVEGSMALWGFKAWAKRIVAE